MRHPILLILSAGGMAAMGAALALAAPAEPRFPISTEDVEARHAEVFATADRNGDGLIDPVEFADFEPKHEGHQRMHAPHAKRHHHTPADMNAEVFAALDSNGDGALSPEEFAWDKQRAAQRQVMKRTMFAHLDQNDDGYLDPDEFPPGRMTDLDVDGDGQISREELRDGRHRRPHRGG